MNFNANNKTANANDGAPQVSILASASTKRMQERRRQSRLLKSTKGMGVGKKYPSIGTHHRNTKHVWLYSELAEVSAAYKEHHTTLPCWKIADMLYYSFTQQVEYNNKKQDQDQDQDQDQPIAQLREQRIHLPSIQAIQIKLMDCISLQHNNDTFGYASSQPSQMHKQVWEHLELAEKHRNMLKKQQSQQHLVQVAAVKQEQQDQQDQQQENPALSTRKLLRHDFLFSTDSEFEATLPPAKRRKVVFDEEESAPQQQQEHQDTYTYYRQEHPATPVAMSKAEFNTGINELMSLMGEADDARRQERALIQRLVGQIREHNEHIGSLVSNIKDSHAEIEHHREAISRKMQQIETIILPVPLPTPAAAAAATTATPAAAAAAPATPPAMVCSKCTRTIEGGLGGFSVSYADPSHPDNETIECYECTPLSPASRKFLEQKEAELEAEYSETERAIEHHLKHEKSCCYSSDDDMYMNDGYYPGFEGGYYDHAEECS
jgi:hypothetical protein